jgi:peroxiredoxin
MKATLALTALALLALCALPACQTSESVAAPAASPSATVAIGKPAPDFKLPALGGGEHSLSQYKGKIVVLEWFNPDCPFVKAAHERGSLKTMARDNKDIVWLAINSNAEGKQGHGDEANTAGKARYGIDHPILFDKDGAVGRAWGASRTPELFVINADGVLSYRGALDNTGSGDLADAKALTNYVQQAIDDLRAGRPVKTTETKPWGCSVKYGG